MKNSLTKMLTFAALASGFTFQAYANSTVDQQHRMESDSAYWNNHSPTMANNNEKAKSMAANSAPNSVPSAVSPYPCAHCVYDPNAGGYVFSPANKR